MNQRELKNIATTCASKILEGEFYREPYKHLIIDNFLPNDLAKKCLESFPKLDDNTWQHENDKNIEVKSRTTWESEFDIPYNIIERVRIINSSLILSSFSKVFGIERLMPDPFFWAAV